MNIDMTNYTYTNSGYPNLPDVLKTYRAKKVVLIGGKRALASAVEKIKSALMDTDVEITGTFVYGTDSTWSNVNRLSQLDEVQSADVLFAIGGGKAIDTVKTISLDLRKPVFTFPTITSNCSAATAISVLYNDDGSFSSYALPKAPVHMFIDGEIIAHAPYEYLWAGIGDGLSKEVEVEFATRNKTLDHTARLGLALSSTCANAFFSHGEQALKDCKAKVISEAIREIALTILVSTGYVSNLTNQKEYYYNSSLAHAFYNGAMVIPSARRHLHGEVVSFGVLVLHAYDGNQVQLEKYAKFNLQLGLPVTLADIDIKASDLKNIALAATQTNEWRNAPYPFTEEKFIKAIEIANQYGELLTR